MIPSNIRQNGSILFDLRGNLTIICQSHTLVLGLDKSLSTLNESIFVKYNFKVRLLM